MPGNVGEVGAGRRPGRPPAPARRPTVRESPASVPSKASRPRSTRSTRSQSRSTSPMSWVVSSSVVPWVAALRDQELAQPLLGEHVEADGRLVEDHQPGGVQQRRRDLGAHPLAQRELADRRRPGTRPSRAARPARRCAPARGRRRGRGSRPGCGTTPAPAGPTTAASAARRRRRPARASRRRSATGRSPQVRTLAAGRHEDADEHLDRGRLAGAVGADVADRLAGLDAHRQVVDGDDRPPAQPVAYAEVPGQPGGLDDRVRVSHPPPPW